MCRLLGVVAREPAALSELAAEDLAPFLTLAQEHGDGWGFAFHDAAAGRVEALKQPQRADTSLDLRALLDTCRSDAALLHLRMASPQFSVSLPNTHPFGDTTTAFAHNGDFTPATCLDEVIGPDLLATAQGDTDSERYYLAVRRRMDDGMEPAKAIRQTADDIRALATRFVALNCLLVTRSALYAYTEHDPHSEVIRRRGPGYFGLHYRNDGGKVVVASTGWAQPAPRWTGLPERHVLEIRRDDLDVVVHGE